MRLTVLFLALCFLVAPAAAPAPQSTSQIQAEWIAKIVAQERAEIALLPKYSPLVETYIQTRRANPEEGMVPAGDRYFLGRALLDKGVVLEPFAHGTKAKHNRVLASLDGLFSMKFLPRGFLQMIYIDANGFDQTHYNFRYIHREFLGEVRCLVFDVSPRVKGQKGRFVGRIWVEDQNFHIVRFNGTFLGSSLTGYYFSFDSWRQNAVGDQWLPSFVFSEEGSTAYPVWKKQITPPFRAQTRFWGYFTGQAQQEAELGTLVVETPVKDESESTNGYSPVQAQRLWTRQAEDNVVATLERIGLMAPHGEVDKVLETVINNLEVTNQLDLQPDVRCRVLMTSSFEAFAIGRTIVVSRGLIDVLPDEASLAAILSHELAHVVLGQGMDTQFAFFDRLQFDETRTFHHFDFQHSPQQELAANRKGSALFLKSPYAAQVESAQVFLRALKERARDLPNLISPHLGDAVPINWALASGSPEGSVTTTDSAASAATTSTKPALVALPLGGRIVIEPFEDRLRLLKSKPAGLVTQGEKMPFEVTPATIYLTRQSIQATQAESTASPTP